MTDTAIRVEGLSKAYQIRHSQTRSHYRTLREDLIALAKRPARNGANQPARETFWALDDVSFEVKHGEALGIIGRNGAGKSTLLKILSRITKPTKGTATVNGRVGSLLEVGTGFHPELTGRENIFLNGAILGMTKRDIQRHFDEIVAFAEVEQFLDTPVKRYSSGMYMRLAFAVAAHLEPEVLVVDEVLAVGDAAFQKKCLGKMSEVASGGRTVLFVSHNMSAVQQLCRRALVLQAGTSIFDGGALQAVEHYQATAAADDEYHVELRQRGWKAHPLMTDIWAESRPENNGNTSLDVRVRIEPDEPLFSPALGLTIEDALGQRVFSVANYFSGISLETIATPTIVSCTIPDLSLRPGVYRINAAAGVVGNPLMDAAYQVISFTVRASQDEDDMRMAYGNYGAWKVRSQWSVQEPA